MPSRIRESDRKILEKLKKKQALRERQNYFKELAKQYVQWKNKYIYREDINNSATSSISVTVSEYEKHIHFIDAHIQRIQDTIARAAFIEYVITLSDNHFKLLFTILQIDLKNRGSVITDLASDSEVDSEGDSDTSPLIPLLLQEFPNNTIHPTILSPEFAQFTQFQQWICSISTKKRYQFNQWLQHKRFNDLEGNTFYRNSMQEQFAAHFLQINSYKNQREFIRWYDQKQQKIFEYYLLLLPKKDKDILKAWIGENYFQALSLAKQSLTQGMKDHYITREDFLNGTEINALVTLVNAHLKKQREKLTVEQKTAIYFNENATPETEYQQRMNELSWKQHKETFLYDPNDEISDVFIKLLTPLNAPNISEGPRSYQSLRDALLTVYERLVLREHDDATEGRKTAAAILFPQNNYHYQNALLYLWGIQIVNNPNEKITINTTFKKINFEDNHSEKPLELAGFKYQGPAYLNYFLSNAQEKLLEMGLQNNSQLMNDFIHDYRANYLTLNAIGAMAIINKILFLGVDYIARTRSIPLILTTMNISMHLTEKNISLLLNALATFFIAPAYLTLNPAADAYHLMKKVLLHPEQLLMETLFWNNIKSDPFYTVFFLLTSISKAMMNALPLQRVLNSSSPVYIASVLASIFSTLAHDLAYDFDHKINHIKNGQYYLNLAWTKSWKDNDPDERAIAQAALLHQCLSMLDQAIRGGFGPAIVAKSFGASESIVLFAAAIGAMSPIVSNYFMDKDLWNSYFVEENTMVTFEQFNRACQDYRHQKQQEPWYEQMVLWGNPFTLLALGGAAIFPMILCEALQLSDINYAIAFGITASITLPFLKDLLEPAAKRNIIMGLAQKLPISILANFSSALAQASYAIGMVFILHAILPSVANPHTYWGKTGILALSTMECFLAYAAFLNKTQSIDQAQQKLGDAISQTSLYRGIKSCKDSSVDGVNTLKFSCQRNARLVSNNMSAMFLGRSTQRTPMATQLFYNDASNHGAELIVDVQNSDSNTDNVSATPYKAFNN